MAKIVVPKPRTQAPPLVFLVPGDLTLWPYFCTCNINNRSLLSGGQCAICWPSIATRSRITCVKTGVQLGLHNPHEAQCAYKDVHEAISKQIATPHSIGIILINYFSWFYYTLESAVFTPRLISFFLSFWWLRVTCNFTSWIVAVLCRFCHESEFNR